MRIASHYLVRIQMVRIDVFVGLVTKRLLANVGAVAALYNIVTVTELFYGDSDDTNSSPNGILKRRNGLIGQLIFPGLVLPRRVELNKVKQFEQIPKEEEGVIE